MKNLQEFGVEELNSKEIKGNSGGALIKITGILDGIKGNTSVSIFC